MFTAGNVFPANRNPLFQSLIIVLILALLTGGFSSSFGGLTITLERVVALPLCCGLLAWGLVRKKFRITKAGLVLILWLLWGLIISVSCDDFASAIRGWAILALAILFYFFGVQASFYKMISCTKTMTVVFTAMSLAAIMTYVYSLCSGANVLTETMLETGVETRVRLTLFEPNLFGAVMIVGCLFSVASFCPNTKTSWIYAFSSHLALLLSFSRAPLLGYIIGLVIYLYLIRRLSFRLIPIVIALALLASMILSFFQLSPGSIASLSRSDSVNTRVLMLSLAWNDILLHPIIGNGIFSFASLHPNSIFLVGSESKGSAWLGIMLYAVLHDTGLFGLFLVLSFFSTIFYKSASTLRSGSSLKFTEHAVRPLAAWYGAAFGLFVAGQATSSYTLGFFWIVIGLVDAIPYELSKVIKNVSRPISPNSCLKKVTLGTPVDV